MPCGHRSQACVAWQQQADLFFVPWQKYATKVPAAAEVEPLNKQIKTLTDKLASIGVTSHQSIHTAQNAAELWVKEREVNLFLSLWPEVLSFWTTAVRIDRAQVWQACVIAAEAIPLSRSMPSFL